VVAFPRSEKIYSLELPEGATVQDALAKAGIVARSAGIFGEQVAPGTRLREGDRVEVYRPLSIDPKEARRRRAVRRR
jgi:putative ubiquitin-RnfH superfamily antitoxin RatB of RatAB toxin-antitoxin module